MALLAPMQFVHKDDPKQAIFNDVGPLAGIEVLNQYVLLGKYVRPAGLMTTGGIELVEEVVKDDRYQTKVGLVLKLGTTASATSFQLRMMPNSFFEVPFGYTGRIDGIWDAATGNMRIGEIT